MVHLSLPFVTVAFAKLPHVKNHFGLQKNGSFCSPVGCMTDPIMSNETIIRRSANYRPPIWDFDFVQSLKSEFVGELNIKRIDKLKEDVKMMLNKTMAPSDQFELIDTLQRLGLAYHFGDEIKRIVKSIYNSHRNDNTWMKEDLHTIALQFRLLRQHGYNISQEIFDIFRDELGNFKECLHEDIEGMLSLYEASYLLEEGENILEVAREFAASCLKKYIQVNKDQLLSMIVSHSLEVPLHWRMPRLETRWFIDIYEKKQGMNPLLLELAKLDFNNVQATYHEDLKYVTRWDVNAMDQLPEYMKLCFLALHNSINEMAYDALREQGFHIIPYLKKAWADLCKSYLVEAKWYYIGYTPTLQEYMDNAWISISAPVILVHAYFLEGSPITNEALKSLKEYPDIIQWSSMILRFADDLGTSSDELKRGDNPKSIQCYIYETGVSELKAREHIQYLIGETWKKINKEREYIDSPFSKIFIEVATNLARMAQCMYQHGDGHGIEDGETKDHVLSLLVKPIPM
eukprot:XP_025015585.1 terpene synthase 10 isoform X1 [Ricinus communis]